LQGSLRSPRAKISSRQELCGIDPSSGRSLDFMCTAPEQGRQASAGFKMPLAIIGLVYPEARVKFNNIDFQTEADFASYYMAIHNSCDGKA